MHSSWGEEWRGAGLRRACPEPAPDAWGVGCIEPCPAVWAQNCHWDRDADSHGHASLRETNRAFSTDSSQSALKWGPQNWPAWLFHR